VLVIGVAGRRLGVRLDVAREVVRAVSTTRVPGAPPWVTGLLNVRGAVVPVVDLRALDARVRSTARGGLVVLVELAGRRAGLRVAEVIGVRPADVTDDTPRAGGGLPLGGVARLTSDAAAAAGDAEGGELPLLDVGAVLDELLDPPPDGEAPP
jgi:purine-binding chemotaxis protein CheW